MKKALFLAWLLGFLIGLVPSSAALACGYGYHLLHHLVNQEIISVSSLQVLSGAKDQKLYKAKVTDLISGSLKKGKSVTLVCEDVLKPERCNLEGRASPFLFVRKDAKGAYRYHPNDGISLRKEDRADLLKFVKSSKKPSALWSQLRRAKNPFIKASVCSALASSMPEDPNLPTCLAEVLATESVSDKEAVLRVFMDKAFQLKKNAASLCNVVKGSFKQSQPNILNEAELNVRTQLACPDNANWLMGELEQSQNEFVTMLIPYHLAFTNDAAAVKKAVEFFEKNPSKLTTVVLDQIAYALFTTKQCDLMDDYIEKGQKQLLGFSRFLPDKWLEGFADNPDWDSIAQHYTRCKGHQPGKSKQLVSLLADSPTDWPFPTKDGKVSFRIQQQAVTSLEMQIAKKFITPQEKGVREAMVHQLQNGHPQVVPEVMHFLKKYYGGPDDLILQVALRPDAKKYWQSHAIMAFMEANQKEKALQVAQASKFKQIQKIGEILKKEAPASVEEQKKSIPQGH